MNRLFYQELSAGKGHSSTVILLHGLFGMSDNLLGLAKELSSDFYVLIPDLINHGRSPHCDQMDYPSMALDIIQLMDSLHIQQACLVGHSMGGKVAMQIASLYPQRVQKLVVVDIAPVTYQARHLEILTAMFKIANRAITLRKEADTLLAEDIEEPALRQFFLKNMYRDEGGLWKWRFGLKQINEAYPKLSAAPELHHVFNEATLFVKGALSDYILPEHESVIRQWFPQAKLKIIQGEGHWLHAEKPAAFNRIVMFFLKT